MNDYIRFQIPSKLIYTKFVEEIAENISAYLDYPSDRNFASKLRAVMNEVFINVVKHSDTSAQSEVVRFQFELGMKYFSVSIYDHGPGFEANGYLPPYPNDLVGREFKWREVLDGSVLFSVVDPFTIHFKFEPKEIDFADHLSEMPELMDHGLGISIITKLMDSVTYAYVGEGRFDWKLIKKLS